MLSKELLNENLKVKMLTHITEAEMRVEFETQQDPAPEILMQARMQFSKKRIFDFIQELQKKDKDERQAIYGQIKQIDE